MASAPQPNLPLFYNDLMPLNSRDHAKLRSRPIENAKWLIGAHAIPLTAEEFIQAGRDYPIVFSSGEDTVPLALMGLNEGVNTYVNEEGRIDDPVYLPAYIRRYPFLLAKLQPTSDDLSLCFDPTTDAVGEFDDGQPLFDDQAQPTEA
ncbi:MAG: SapC family protein, partial [Tsuneonella sp.]